VAENYFVKVLVPFIGVRFNLNIRHMDYKLVFEQLLKIFHEKHVRYALIGGFALGVQGVSRATTDIDFLVHLNDMPKIHMILCKLGYERLYQSENVSQYKSPLKILGAVDFLHAFREISINMLQRAQEKKIFDETIALKVVTVEDLIGLKVQAMENDKSRKSSELADIESLLAKHRQSVDWDLLNSFFSLFRLDELFGQLKKRYGHAE